MKKWRRMLAFLLASVMVAATGLPSSAAEKETGYTEIKNLTVDYVTNPCGIDNETPVFSWNMESDITGQKQTAYEITVTDENGATVWDTEKVESDVSIGIPYAGDALQSSAKYTWSVTVWDKDGKEVKSEEDAYFEMGLLEENAFDDVNWIRMLKEGDPDPDAPEEQIDTSKYTIESSFKFKDAVGFIFAGKDNAHFYMWQLNNDMENDVEGSYLRPHVWNGGGALYNPEGKQNFNGYELDEALTDDTVYQLKLKVNVDDKTVATYIDGELVNQVTCPDADLSYGKIGFRQAKNADQEINEEAWIDNLKVTAADGTILFYQDFSLASDTEIDGGEVTDGWLHLLSGQEQNITDKVFFQTDSTSYYRFDVDFKINNNQAAIIYGANADGSQYYATQVKTDGSGARIAQIFKPASGGASEFDKASIEGMTNEQLLGSAHHFTVVANMQKEAWIYVDGTKVKYHDKLNDFIFDGKVGFRPDQGDDVDYDNAVVKINGTPEIFSDFSSSENIFNGGTVKDGTLNVTGGTEIFSNDMISGSTADISAEPVHFTYDADLTITGDAAGLVFAGKDSNNFYMWQLNGVDHEGELYLRPHIWANGTANYNGYEVDLSDKFDFETEIKNQQIHVKLDVTNEKVVTYINDQEVNTFDLSGKPGTIVDGMVGLRSGAAGEDFTVDNLKVVSYDSEGNETIKYDYNFDDGVNPFSGSAGQASSSQVVDGRFVVKSNSGLLMTEDLSKIGMPMFRKTFTADKEIKSAKIYASALGVYDLYINGERVGSTDADGNKVYDELKPGWTDYSKRVLYQSYDVTDMIRSGEDNVLLSMLGTGWWTGRVSYNTYGSKDMAFLAKMIITYTDGSTETINTDNTWMASRNGAIREADIWDGETYDANYAGAQEISQSSYEPDDSWERAAYSNDFTGTISAQVGQTVQVRKELTRTPESITVYNGTVDNGSDYGKINVVNDSYTADDVIELQAGETVIFDMGQNMVGWPNINITAPQGTKVVMHFAEMLNDSGQTARGNDGPEGSLYIANYRSAKSTGTYIANGSEQGETYRPTFTFYGFRYMSITATENIKINSLTGEVVGSATPETGTLETSDDSVNQLISNIVWGQRGNYLSVPTDCPQRDERLGWSGDTQIFVGAASYNANVAGFFHKWAYDAMDSQQADGTYTDTIPRSSAVGTGNAAWGDAGIIVPYTMYKMYGDTQIVTDMYDSMTKYMNWLESRGYVGAGTGYGDWLAYESNEGPVRNLIACAYYANDTLMMAEMCGAIGKTDEADQYRQRYTEIKSYFQENFLNEDGTLKEENSTQTCYLMAIKSDMFAKPEQKQAAVDALVQKIKDNGNKLGTGFVGTGTLTQTLSDVGESNMAYTLLLQRDNPSWLYSVDQGATTIWERWNSYTLESGFGDVSMNSFNHYSYGAVLEWMYSDMLGIDSDIEHPGFKHIILQPQPDTREDSEIPDNQQRMTSVKGTYESMYGTIKAEWENTDGVFEYAATVPANTTATLYLPVEEGKNVSVNGEDLQSEIAGVTLTDTTDEKNIFELESGTYHFTVTSEEEEQPAGAVDKTALEKLVSEINDMDLGQYTQESVSALQKALEEAQTILDDETLTTEDQNKVDEQVEKLQSALDALTKNNDGAGGDDGSDTPGKPDTPDNPDGGTGSDTDTPNTPDGGTGGNADTPGTGTDKPAGNASDPDQGAPDAGGNTSNASDSDGSTVQTGDNTDISMIFAMGTIVVISAAVAGIVILQRRKKH